MTIIFTGAMKKAGGFRVADVSVPVAPAFSIGESLLFNDDDSSYMIRTSTAGDPKIWTWSGWVKRGNLGTGQYLFGANETGVSDRDSALGFQNSDKLRFIDNEHLVDLLTTQVFRDPSAWYHIVCAVDTTQGTASNRMKIYINGVQNTVWDTETHYAQNDTPSFNESGKKLTIGAREQTSSINGYFDGYMSQTVFVDGLQLDPTSFGEFDSNGDWNPIDASGLIFGTNGFHLDYAVAPGTGDGGGTDVSGEENHLTDSGLTASDQVSDTPTVNYPTISSIDFNNGTGTTVFKDGNLTWNGSDGDVRCTMTIPQTVKIYYEITITHLSGAGIDVETGVVNPEAPIDSVRIGGAGAASDGASYSYDGDVRINGSSVDTEATFVDGDVIMTAIDIANGKLWFGKNGTWHNSGDPSAGTGSYDISGISKTLIPGMGDGAGSWVNDATVNFGQKTFAYPIGGGNSTTGFLELNSSNLSTVIASPGLYFNTVLYVGNGGTQSIADVGFKPDMVWLKDRDAGFSHNVTDNVRGATKTIFTDESATAELTGAGRLTSFDAAGFSIGSTGAVNTNNDNYVAWAWKGDNVAGGTLNELGTEDSVVNVNTTSGFSIVTYTGVSGVQTMGHGLGVIPSMLITQNLTDGAIWAVVHKDMNGGTNPANNWLRLSENNAEGANSNMWNNAFPTADVFTVRDALETGTLNKNYVAYLWAEVEGFSKIGSYTGNGSTNGPFVYCGFRPAYVLLKRTGAAQEWQIWDSARTINNEMQLFLKADIPDAEPAASSINNNLDFLSNGFKLREGNGGMNASDTYIFAAFAESPFKTARAR